MTTTFAVDDVEVEQSPAKTLTQGALLSKMTKGASEAISAPARVVCDVPHNHQLMQAVHLAFARHYPLVLTPDVIWLTIAQGLAVHINKNAEKLRKKFVAHEGKLVLDVRRDGFVRGAPDNDWPNVFAEFSSKIKEHIGETTHARVVSDFTTTGPIERAASEIVLMDAMQAYFEYLFRTMCGIPTVTLEGTVEDWEKMRERVHALHTLDLGLDFWLPSVDRVLEGFVDAAKGEADKSWWSSIYKLSGGSGGPYINGWITWLLPYLSNGSLNPTIGNEERPAMCSRVSISDDDYPSSLAKAPFVWKYYDELFDYEFIAGLTGVEQDLLTMAVKPVVGWAVRQKHEGPSEKAKMVNGKLVYNDPTVRPEPAQREARWL